MQLDLCYVDVLTNYPLCGILDRTLMSIRVILWFDRSYAFCNRSRFKYVVKICFV